MNRFVTVVAVAILCWHVQCLRGMVLLEDNSIIKGTRSGQLAVAYRTVAPFGPTTDSGRYYDYGSGYQFNAGSFTGGGVSTSYNGGYKVLQNSPLGQDGLLLAVSSFANSSASVSYGSVAFWNITGGLEATSTTETLVDLVFRCNQAQGYYLFSFLHDWQYASLSVNGVGVAQGTQSLVVQADPAGLLDFHAVLMAQSASLNGASSTQMADTFQFQLKPTTVPEPTGFPLLALAGIGLLGRRRTAPNRKRCHPCGRHL